MEACEILARKSNGQANGFAGAGGWNIAPGQPQGSNESNVPETPDLLWSKWENRNDLNRPDFFIENAASPNFGPFGPVNNLAFDSPNNAMGQPNRYQMGLPRGPYAMARPMANPMMGTPNCPVGAPVNVFILNGGRQNGVGAHASVVGGSQDYCPNPWATMAVASSTELLKTLDTMLSSRSAGQMSLQA